MAERIESVIGVSMNACARRGVPRSRCSRQQEPRGPPRCPDLSGLEVLDRGERFLGAQTLDEGAAEAASVQIHLALEQMDFEHPVAAAEGGRTPRLATASCQTGSRVSQVARTA